MKLKNSIFCLTILMMISCSREPGTAELSNPGFGITATTIEARPEGVDIPVYLNSADVIKGIQFTLRWDSSVGQVIRPEITPENPGFTVSSSDASMGQMKVLIFSMSGDHLKETDKEVLMIPVRIMDANATTFSLNFEDVIFAGPKATSYNIPVTTAKLKIVR